MKTGRPSKYDPAFCEVVVEAGKQGMGLAEMAAEIDVDRKTINNWMDQHEEFFHAVKRALGLSQAWWESKGRIATFSDEPFNATSFIFNMKNRFREDWADRKELDHKSTDGTMSPTRIERVFVDPNTPDKDA